MGRCHSVPVLLRYWRTCMLHLPFPALPLTKRISLNLKVAAAIRLPQIALGKRLRENGEPQMMGFELLYQNHVELQGTDMPAAGTQPSHRHSLPLHPFFRNVLSCHKAWERQRSWHKKHISGKKSEGWVSWVLDLWWESKKCQIGSPSVSTIPSQGVHAQPEMPSVTARSYTNYLGNRGQNTSHGWAEMTRIEKLVLPALNGVYSEGKYRNTECTLTVIGSISRERAQEICQAFLLRDFILFLEGSILSQFQWPYLTEIMLCFN